MKEILRVLIGSQAHGLANENSDFDYRGVFVQPTVEILRLGSTKRNTNWIEGKNDVTSWEIGHFLNLSTKSNPTILETYLAPVVGAPHPLGTSLRALFDHVWSSKGVRDAFIGYGLNQRKKFLEGKDSRPHKYAAAYLRVLYNAYELLSTGSFTITIANTSVGEMVREFKEGHYTAGKVIDVCQAWQESVERAYNNNPGKEVNLEAVNDYLLDLRSRCWEGVHLQYDELAGLTPNKDS
jgi:predicted nucleotidyltransferase